MLDNTFRTPYLVKVFDHGVDMVVHPDTNILLSFKCGRF